MKKLSPRHHNIIRLIHLGLSQTEVSERIGMSKPALSCFLSSTLAKAELERLRHETDKNIVHIVDREKLINDLSQAAEEAVTLSRNIMNDPTVDIKVRSRHAINFMDRVIFDVDDGKKEKESFKDLLSTLSRFEAKLDGNMIEVKAEEVKQ